MQIIACEYKWNTVTLSGSMEKLYYKIECIIVSL